MKKTNYIANYYKGGFHKEENIETPFNVSKSDEYEKKLRQRNKAVNTLKKLTEEVQNLKIIEGLKLVEKAEFSKYVLAYKPYRTYSDKHHFNISDGKRIEKSQVVEEHIKINVEKKRGSFFIPYGYLFERGIVYVNKMRYTISPKNLSVTMLRDSVVAIHVLSGKYFVLEGEEFVESNKFSNYTHWNYSDRFTNVKIPEFIKTMYGVDYAPNKSASEYTRAIKENELFEEILKTAPRWVIDDNLFKEYKKETTPNMLAIYKLNKNDREKLNDKDSFTKYYLMKKVFIDDRADEEKITEKQLEELFDVYDEILEECQLHQISLQDGNFQYRDPNFSGMSWEWVRSISTDFRVLAKVWDGYPKVRKNYTPKKFYRYLLDAVVNQGFTNLSSFMDTLHDYLSMCQLQRMKPVLYSDYLRRTHDTLARNQRIKLSEDEFAFFESQYVDTNFAYAPKDGKYCIVAPTVPQEVINEGNNLSHCVASYVKRIAAGKTHIVFLRTQEKKEQSLVTVQVTNNVVVQARGSSNRKLKEEEVEFLVNWAEKRKITWGL